MTPHVYFISDPRSGRIKIGASRQVPGRIKALRSQEGAPLSLLGVIPKAGQTGERELHERFSDYALGDEWFEDHEEIRGFVSEHSDPDATAEMERAVGRADPQVQEWLQKTMAPSLRYMRAHKNWTQEELADRSGVSRNYISLLERGRSEPSATTLLRLANALDVTVGELLDHNL